MAALWNIKYETKNADGSTTEASTYFHSADAKSMKRKDINASRVNAAKRCKARFAKKGVKITVVGLQCVG